MNSCLFRRELRFSTLSLLVTAFGATALHADAPAQSLFEALRKGDAAKVKAAINHGVDANSADEYGNTLLMHAAVYGTVADLDFLVAHGAQANAANKAGHTALMRALPDLAKINLLVEHGADVNAATAVGATPLIMAAHIPSAEDVVRYLIGKGADLRAASKAGQDAIFAAAYQGAAANLENPIGCRDQRQEPLEGRPCSPGGPAPTSVSL
jgi:ankyrin repeat protein